MFFPAARHGLKEPIRVSNNFITVILAVFIAKMVTVV